MRIFFIILAFLCLLSTQSFAISESVDTLEVLESIRYSDGSIQTSAYAKIYSSISTNLTFRHEWTAWGVYQSNDFVSYEGNLFNVYTNQSEVGQAPSLDSNGVGINNAFWDVLVKRGQSGQVVTQYVFEAASSSTNYIGWASNSTDSSRSYWKYCLTNGTGGAITQQVFRYVSSPTNFISWRSNSLDNKISYWDGCITNGGMGGVGTINITNVVVAGTTYVTNNFYMTNNLSVDSYFTNIFYTTNLLEVTASFITTNINTSTNNIFVTNYFVPINTFVVTNRVTNLNIVTVTNVNNISNQFTLGSINTTITNLFAPSNTIVAGTTYVSNSFNITNNISNTISVAASTINITNNVSNTVVAGTTYVTNTFSITNNISNNVSIAASTIYVTNNNTVNPTYDLTFAPTNIIENNQTNIFSPTNIVNAGDVIITNNFSPTNIITVGETTVIQSNTFNTTISNNVEGVVITNVITINNITQTNEFVPNIFVYNTVSNWLSVDEENCSIYFNTNYMNPFTVEFTETTSNYYGFDGNVLKLYFKTNYSSSFTTENYEGNTNWSSIEGGILKIYFKTNYSSSGGTTELAAERTYSPINIVSNVATIGTNSALFLRLDSSTNALSIEMASSGFDASKAYRWNLQVIRGTNTISWFTNGPVVSGTSFLSVPASSTNHFLLDRYPGDSTFTILQIYR